MPRTISCECGEEFELPAPNALPPERCPNCGRDLTEASAESSLDMTSDTPTSEPRAISGYAITSLIGGVAFFMGCVSGIPAICLGIAARREIARSGGRVFGRWAANVGIILGVIGCLYTYVILVTIPRYTHEAARRSGCVSNLRQIAVGLVNYHDANGCLPAASITDKNGKPLLSWRVAILPYMEGMGTTALYEKFHLDEPWDSPHNLTLLDERPSFYACPIDSGLKSEMTSFRVVVDPSTPFTPDFKPVRFSDIADGPEKTLLVGETRDGVPWTKPEDLPMDMAVPLSGFGSHHGDNDGFHAFFAYEGVRFLKATIAPDVLRALLTRNGGEPISADQF